MPDDASNLAGHGYLTPERIMMRDVARQFVREVVLPTANRLDPVKGDIPQDLIDQMGRLGAARDDAPEIHLGVLEAVCVEDRLQAVKRLQVGGLVRDRDIRVEDGPALIRALVADGLEGVARPKVAKVLQLGQDRLHLGIVL